MINKRTVLLLLLLALAGSRLARAKQILELFLVSPTAEDVLHYGRQTARLNKRSGDPDAVAQRLLRNLCQPALLHSTSWRWEKDGTLVLTYLAFSEDTRCAMAEPVSVKVSDLLSPRTTDPLKPRPDVIREGDVLAHALRHITFLMRYSADDRIRNAVSPASLRFFQGLCGQLAGRFESAREFSDCTLPGAASVPR